MSEQQNVELVQKAYQAFGTGDIPNLLKMMDENIEWRSPEVAGSPIVGTCDGREAVREFFQSLGEHETFSKFEPHEFIAQGDKVVVLGSMTATTNVTGREYSTDWAHIFTVRDGAIAGFKELYDTAAVSQAYQKAASA